MDWASECAIDATLKFFLEAGIKPTVFTTHCSKTVAALQDQLDVGLHPYFSKDSSHGATIHATINTVSCLPYNLPAFRCHRFKSSNQVMEAMYELGMRISSNICTDLEHLPPFVNRYGMVEFPIFLEDGGYLWQRHALRLTNLVLQQLHKPGGKVLLIHPMHFALNSPNFSFMKKIKQCHSREEWISMPTDELQALRHKGRGIRNVIEDILEEVNEFSTLRVEYNKVIASEQFRLRPYSNMHKSL